MDKKDILVIGGGGREHAICHKLSQSKKVNRIFCAPGNAGINQIATCVDIKATDIDAIIDYVKSNENIYMTVVAPDDPLSLGLVDKLTDLGFRAFGPKRAAAKIESSKVFAKNLMKKYGIPTADYASFDNFDGANAYLLKAKHPLVIKADGLALGKGVIICDTPSESLSALKNMMIDDAFGRAGSSVVIEEFLEGREVSLFAFTDGETVKLMPPSRDYKRIYDGDKGLNTGGMGAFSPVPDFDSYLHQAEEKIVLPTIKAMKNENCPFKGVLYFGLMVTKSGVKVIEYNARFGDPETQVVLPGLKSDLLDIFDAIIDERLQDISIEWDNKARVCVVAASNGYPLQYKKGEEILLGGQIKDTEIFHAGTAIRDCRMVTCGGRVLCVSAFADTIKEAREKAYRGISKIIFNGIYYRTDIAKDI